MAKKDGVHDIDGHRSQEIEERAEHVRRRWAVGQIAITLTRTSSSSFELRARFLRLSFQISAKMPLQRAPVWLELSLGNGDTAILSLLLHLSTSPLRTLPSTYPYITLHSSPRGRKVFVFRGSKSKLFD